MNLIPHLSVSMPTAIVDLHSAIRAFRWPRTRRPLFALLLAAAGCAVPVAEEADAVAMYRGGADRLGRYDAPPIRYYGGLQWRFETEGPVRSTPVVAGGTVYVGSGDGRLYAIDLETGDPVWSFDAGSSISSSPAVTQGRVYFTARDNALYAVNRADGRLAFRVQTGPDTAWAWGHESGDLWTSSPAVSGDVVVFGSGDGGVYAADAGSGAIRWRYVTEGRVRSSPAVREGRVYVGSMDGSLHILDLATGAGLARGDTEGRGMFSGDYGFDRRSVQSTPAVTADGAYVGAKDGSLYAFGHDGARLWRNDHTMSWVLGGPAVGDGVIFDGSSDGRYVQAVNTATGEELWRFMATGVVWASPAFAGGVVYAGDGTGLMFALDAATGTELWRFRAGGALRGSATPAGDLLLFGSDDGAVYAVRGAEGPLERAVYWDSTAETLSYYSDSPRLRDALARAEYRIVDDAALLAWLGQRTSDCTASVVVFSVDRLPEALLPDAQGASPLLDYLNAGGKVVWVGIPPLLRRIDAATGQPPQLLNTGWDAAARFLGVDYGPAIFDAYGSKPTAAGRRWGLSRPVLTAWSAAVTPAIEPLALDERGDAAMFVRGFGGAAGTGFVQIWPDARPVPDLMMIRAAAEYRPR